MLLDSPSPVGGLWGWHPKRCGRHVWKHGQQSHSCHRTTWLPVCVQKYTFSVSDLSHLCILGHSPNTEFQVDTKQHMAPITGTMQNTSSLASMFHVLFHPSLPVWSNYQQCLLLYPSCSFLSLSQLCNVIAETYYTIDVDVDVYLCYVKCSTERTI